MPKRAKVAKIERQGVTLKISVSVGRDDLVLLKRRAQRLYGGNLSAAVSEGVRHIREQEGREALLKWLGPAAEATEAQIAEIHAEWNSPIPPPPKRRKP